MADVLSYLDCGCAICTDGSRLWCPSCVCKYPRPDPVRDAAARLIAHAKWTEDDQGSYWQVRSEDVNILRAVLRGPG